MVGLFHFHFLPFIHRTGHLHIYHRRPKLTIREIDRINDLCKRMNDLCKRMSDLCKRFEWDVTT